MEQKFTASKFLTILQSVTFSFTGQMNAIDFQDTMISRLALDWTPSLLKIPGIGDLFFPMELK